MATAKFENVFATTEPIRSVSGRSGRNRWQQIVHDFRLGRGSTNGDQTVDGIAVPRAIRGHLRGGSAATMLPHGAENDETEQYELENPGRAGPLVLRTRHE